MEDLLRKLSAAVALATAAAVEVTTSISTTASDVVGDNDAANVVTTFHDVLPWPSDNDTPAVQPVVYCTCDPQCCAPNNLPSLIIGGSLVIFMLVTTIVCCWKYCIQFHYNLEETGWLLKDAPPPPFASPQPRTKSDARTPPFNPLIHYTGAPVYAPRVTNLNEKDEKRYLLV